MHSISEEHPVQLMNKSGISQSQGYISVTWEPPGKKHQLAAASLGAQNTLLALASGQTLPSSTALKLQMCPQVPSPSKWDRLSISDKSYPHYRLLSWILSWTLSLVKHELVRLVTAHTGINPAQQHLTWWQVSPGSGTGDKSIQGTYHGTARPAWCIAVLARISAGP